MKSCSQNQLCIFDVLAGFTCSLTISTCMQWGRTQEVLVQVTSHGAIKINTPRKHNRRCQQDFNNTLFSVTGILIYCNKYFISSWCRVSLIFVLVIYTSLNSRGYKIKLKTTPCTAFSIDNDAYYWDIQSAAAMHFPGVKCPGTRTWTSVKFPPIWDLTCVKCLGVARGGGGWAILDLTHTLYTIQCLTYRLCCVFWQTEYIYWLNIKYFEADWFLNPEWLEYPKLMLIFLGDTSHKTFKLPTAGRSKIC